MKKLLSGLLLLTFILSQAQLGFAGDGGTESLKKVIAQKRKDILAVQGEIIKKKNEVIDILTQLKEAEVNHENHAGKAYISLLVSGAGIVASVALFRLARYHGNNAIGLTSIGVGIFGVGAGVNAGMQKYWAHASQEQVNELTKNLKALNKELDAYNTELSNDLAIIMAADKNVAEQD